jgi:hypothetical protein
MSTMEKTFQPSPEFTPETHPWFPGWEDQDFEIIRRAGMTWTLAQKIEWLSAAKVLVRRLKLFRTPDGRFHYPHDGEVTQ